MIGPVSDKSVLCYFCENSTSVADVPVINTTWWIVILIYLDIFACEIVENVIMTLSSARLSCWNLQALPSLPVDGEHNEHQGGENVAASSYLKMALYCPEGSGTLHQQ